MDFFPDELKKQAFENTDEALVQKYQRGDTTALNELITRHKDLLDFKSGAFRSVPVPQAAVGGHAMEQLSIAAKKFDPNSGVKFRTFLDSYLRGLNRYVHRHKGMLSFPDNKMLMLSKFQEAERMLKMRFGYAPDNLIADSMGIPTKDVQQLRRKLGQKELAESGLQNQTAVNQLQDVHVSTIQERGVLVYDGLTQIEKDVYDYAVGGHGKPKLPTSNDIAMRTGLSPSKVARIRKGLAKRVKAIYKYEPNEL